jgi:hypothetical protein
MKTKHKKDTKQPRTKEGRAALRLLKQGKLSYRAIGKRVGLSGARVHQIKMAFLD